jgi:hypothetical protein
VSDGLDTSPFDVEDAKAPGSLVDQKGLVRTGDTMTVYDREWVANGDLPRLSRLRFRLTTDGGTPTRFLIQLEYWHAGEWLEVARADHDVDGPAYRNVERSGIHIDIYHPERGQIGKIQQWPPQPADKAMGVAEDFLRRHAETYVRRFVSWL